MDYSVERRKQRALVISRRDQKRYTRRAYKYLSIRTWAIKLPQGVGVQYRKKEVIILVISRRDH